MFELCHLNASLSSFPSVGVTEPGADRIIIIYGMIHCYQYSVGIAVAEDMHLVACLAFRPCEAPMRSIQGS